jgi:hypothetical protein
MAKRIKVNGKTPQGLSKSQRRDLNRLQSKRAALLRYDRELGRAGAPEGVDPEAIERLDYFIEDALERRDVSARPSSTRKKRVKEGSPKFVGPRQLSSELNENYDSVTRRAGGLNRDRKRGVKKIRGSEDESEPISSNNEIYRRIGEMILRRVGSRRV